MQEETIAFLDDIAWGGSYERSDLTSTEGKRAHSLSLSLPPTSLPPAFLPSFLSLSLSVRVSFSDLTSTQCRLEIELNVK